MAAYGSDYEAATFLLSAPALDGRADRFVRDGRVDWLGLLGECDSMSSGQRLLVRAAYDLWSGEANVGLRELALRLDGTSLVRLAAALGVASGRRPAPERPALRLVRGGRG